ncbi:hypothetical protein C5748_17340 [Phyllobacterium phragmitis]|uniref:Uncharacterized protein n=1 Tax=Phyllobacterium phragmitis TaxID=2670329 RepID=A0A2S9INW7_9HYPH|nr:hypothetical protein [Phyllobacterium phragmitis]PRD42227.1 hypothetical protein C5748_17340 [Phyllobacterium phragmitis]
MNVTLTLYDGVEVINRFDLPSGISSDLEVEVAMKCLLSTSLNPEEVFESLFGSRTELQIRKDKAANGNRLLTAGSNPHVVAQISGE